jgi:hypothetical protein
MSTTYKLEKKLVVASALVATLPGLLFLGAGTAQAKTCVVQGESGVLMSLGIRGIPLLASPSTLPTT